jgi:phosphoglycerate kinase
MAQFIAGLTGVKSVVAGGDTVETITKLHLHDKYAFVSTGGGAALEFLAGDELPGVKALEKKEEAAKE